MKVENKNILLGLSGGVDSSVAALLLKKQGYNVIGAFFKIYSKTKNKLTGECTYLEDKRDAQKIANLLEIPLITLDYESEYKKLVLNPMFKAYSNGLTPNPDIACNTIIKFPLLWKIAKKYNADYISTGHYARIKKRKNNYELLMGKDAKKDQSYFLSGLTQFDLEHTIFPIGDYSKDRIRKIAKENNFSNWNKHGTVGICFVGKQNMQDFLKQKIKSKTGKVIDFKGEEIGTHIGNSFYTIGQKAINHFGIDIKKPKEQSQKRFYVAEKRRGNILVVAPEGHSILKRKQVIIKNFRLINKEEKINEKLGARIRHLGKIFSGKLNKIKNKWIFNFNNLIEGISEGQYIVLYSKNKVIGCGEIRYKKV